MTAVIATSRAALAEAWANRAGFWGQIVAMFLNDVAWIAFWVLFFDQVGSVRGWERDDVLMLLAAFTVSAGLVLGILANARSIGTLAMHGELDAALALPVHPLAYLLVRRVNAANLGDVAFGCVLFAVAGGSVERAPVFALAVVCAAAVLTGFLVLTGSLVFFVGHDDAGELAFHSMMIFSAYPADVFSGATKMLLFSVVPAAFVGSVPARLVQSIDAGTAIALVTVAAVFVGAGWAAFTLGLRRYTSGAVWTRA